LAVSSESLLNSNAVREMLSGDCGGRGRTPSRSLLGAAKGNRMQGGRVGIVGGSIAGCAVALAAARGKADETVVFERATGELRERGVGLALNEDRYAELEAAGFVDDGMPWAAVSSRRWFAQGEESALGREIATVPFRARAYNWGSLWHELRRRIPAAVEYRAGAAVVEVRDGADAATVALADGNEERFDLVVGADGYRSIVRASLFPDTQPEYAGYFLWRGTFPVERLAELDGLLRRGERWSAQEAATVGVTGGHMIAYRIPDTTGINQVMNWGLYGQAPASALGVKLDEPTSIPPGTMTDTLLDYLLAQADDLLPPYWAAMVRLTDRERFFVQPIYDLEVPGYVGLRTLLAGDAATITRPHAGAGATKALQDAATLDRLWAQASDWPELLNGYGAARLPVGRAAVDLGRRIGRDQVVDAPQWTDLDPAGFQAWLASTMRSDPVGGRSLAAR
jgi:2-polyprenyl-6-methoxyphenol hydroxylase-like FAD-dependent oxidoreductase